MFIWLLRAVGGGTSLILSLVLVSTLYHWGKVYLKESPVCVYSSTSHVSFKAQERCHLQSTILCDYSYIDPQSRKHGSSGAHASSRQSSWHLCPNISTHRPRITVCSLLHALPHEAAHKALDEHLSDRSRSNSSKVAIFKGQIAI